VSSRFGLFRYFTSSIAWLFMGWNLCNWIEVRPLTHEVVEYGRLFKELNGKFDGLNKQVDEVMARNEATVGSFRKLVDEANSNTQRSNATAVRAMREWRSLCSDYNELAGELNQYPGHDLSRMNCLVTVRRK